MTSLHDREEATPRMLDGLRALVADDGYAATFQTLGQYRTAILCAVDSVLASSSTGAAPTLPRIPDDTLRSLVHEAQEEIEHTESWPTAYAIADWLSARGVRVQPPEGAAPRDSYSEAFTKSFRLTPRALSDELTTARGAVQHGDAPHTGVLAIDALELHIKALEAELRAVQGTDPKPSEPPRSGCPVCGGFAAHSGNCPRAAPEPSEAASDHANDGMKRYANGDFAYGGPAPSGPRCAAP